MTKHKGFSLVELLVVVAVVGLLITLSTVGYVRVNNNSINSSRETDAKILASALENASVYTEGTLKCTDITGSPDEVASLLEIEAKDIATKDDPTKTRISCTRKINDIDEALKVSGLGCQTIKVQYNKKGSSVMGEVTVKGPAPTSTCLYNGDAS